MRREEKRREKCRRNEGSVEGTIRIKMTRVEKRMEENEDEIKKNAIS